MYSTVLSVAADFFKGGYMIGCGIWQPDFQKDQLVKVQLRFTPPKINIEPENDGLEDDFPLPGVYSQVPC